MAETAETHILGNAYLNRLGSSEAAVRHLERGTDGGFVGALITILEGGQEREVELRVGETFTAGGEVWRLDGIERFETDKIGDRHLEATVTRVG